MLRISTITLTRNEEKDIKRCLSSLQWADERIVIDSRSEDATAPKAAKFSARVIQRKMKDFSTLRNIGIDEARGEWVLMVDADEVIPRELADEIRAAIKDEAFSGYYINRINYMYGMRLHHDQPDYQLRLFKKDSVKFKNSVHEQAVVKGRTGRLKNSFPHYSMKDLHEHVDKMNLYTDLAAAESADSSLALFLKPFYRLVSLLIGKRAYRDGMTGVILSLHAFFYEFIVLFKIWERRHISRDWFSFYGGVDAEKEMMHQNQVHKELIDLIIASAPQRVLEIGTGAAALSMFLVKEKNANLISVDRSLDVLKKVKKDAARLGIDMRLVCADGFKLPFKDNAFSIVFSQGVLEHFSDSDIKAMLKEKLRIASDSALFSVPNSYYNHRDLGDERLLPKRRWEAILSGFNIAESRNYYRLRAKRNLLRPLPIMYMCRIRKR